MRKYVKHIVIICIMVAVGGCSSVDKYFNIYQDEFSCVNNPGKADCTDTVEALNAAYSTPGSSLEGSCSSCDEEGGKEIGGLSAGQESIAVGSPELSVSEEGRPMVEPGEYRRVLVRGMIYGNRLVGDHYVYYERKPWQWGGYVSDIGVVGR